MLNSLHINAKWKGLLGLVVGAWLIMLVLDWTLRFVWYGYHKQFLSQPTVAIQGGETKAFTHYDREPEWGGDLAGLIGIPEVARRYSDFIPGGRDTFDVYQNRNPSGVFWQDSDIVVVGDSYMGTGMPITNMFAARLSEILNEPVYNHAIAGRGPVYAMSRLYAAPYFKEKPPTYLIYGWVERELDVQTVAGSLLSDIFFADNQDRAPTQFKRDKFSKFRAKLKLVSPKRLKEKLPNSSIIAQASKKVWNKVRYLLFRKISSEVVASTHSVLNQGDMLFYLYALETMEWSSEVRAVPLIANAFKYFSDYLKEHHHVTVVYVLIPDKARVYEEAVPTYHNGKTYHYPESCLPELQHLSEEQGVHIVNMLPTFLNEKRKGRLIYLRGDTHWNPEGIRLAASEVAEVIQDITKASEGSLE